MLQNVTTHCDLMMLAQKNNPRFSFDSHHHTYGGSLAGPSIGARGARGGRLRFAPSGGLTGPSAGSVEPKACFGCTNGGAG